MATKFGKLEPKHHAFIARQHMFFTGSAATSGRVNISPRSTDLFRVLGDNAVLYLDRTGSGNETSAHLTENGRMTIMMCAFDGPPLIMRLYGKGRVIAHGSAEYGKVLADQFDGQEPPGARQMIRLDFDLVQTSCGFGVPLFDYAEERTALEKWAVKQGPEGIEKYWRTHNSVSLDGLPTGMGEPAEN